MSDNLKRRIEKFLSPDEPDEVKELRAPSGIVQTDNQPYDRLRKRLRNAGLPDVLSLNDSKDKDEK